MLTLGMGAQACNPKDPRCASINVLVAGLGYSGSLAELQMGCRGRARGNHPDELDARSAAQLMGIKPGSAAWPKVVAAWDMYVDEACGAEEIVALLLAAYKLAWDKRHPGKELDEVVARFKSGGRDSIQAEAQQISDDVNRVMGPLMQSMVASAAENYESRIKGAIGFAGLEAPNTSICIAPAR